ncbi:MAG: response regulator [Bacteroidetes bacterium]|nr:response regulator [Bacteroidota bacterium]
MMDKEMKKETILVVDDTPANLEILLRVFQIEGYKVRAVTSGPMGIRAAGNDPPDIILLDVSMPEMNGYETCKILKKNEALKNIPVIFISALTETFDKVTAFESGGVDYITKPIQIEEALARVKTHLALRKYQFLLEEKNRELSETIDHLKEAQSQLINSEKMASLGVLTAGIAHEINNPISFIYTSSLGLSKDIAFFLDMQKKYEDAFQKCDQPLMQEINEYKQDYDFDERFAELSQLSENIITGAKRISGIVQSLRLFSRIDEADLKEIDLVENIESTILLLHHKISNKINVVREYGTIPPVPCFPAKISQVFMNVLSNAIEAIEEKHPMTDNEQIVIVTKLIKRKDVPYVNIEISDTGKGIPEKVMNHIFDPFFTTKPVGKGMGLGLSITNNIIKEHGGVIEASAIENQGTTFRILLPIRNTEIKL